MSYILLNLFARKVRTGLCLLGVAVSVAMIVAILSVSIGLRQSVNDYMAASGAELAVFSRAAADLTFSRVSIEDVGKIRALPGVQDISRANFYMSMSPRAGAGGRQAGMVALFGRFPGERLMEKYEEMHLEGRLPQSIGEILVGEYAAREMGLRIGDRLKLLDRPYQGIEEFEVVGTYRTPIAWENLGIVCHAEVIQHQLNSWDRYSLIFVYCDPNEADAIRSRIEGDMPHLVAVPVGEFTERFSDQTKYIDEFIAILTIIAVGVGILGVLNTMMMSISERVREIGTLRALGWTKGRILRVVVGEGLIISLSGGLLGLGAGVAGTEMLLAWFPSGLLEAAYVPATFVKGFVVAILVGLLGAIYPGWRAASLRPVEALRYE